MNEAGIVKSTNPEILGAVLENKGLVLMAVWEMEVDPDLQSFLEEKDAEEIFTRKGRSSDKATVALKYEEVKSGRFNLGPYEKTLNRLNQAFEDYAQTKSLGPKTVIFRPGFTLASSRVHRDPRGKKRKDGNVNVAGISIFKSGKNGVGGEFQYVNKCDEHHIVNVDDLRMSHVDPKYLQKLELGQMGLFVTGRDPGRFGELGLCHNGSAMQGAYRWRVTMRAMAPGA